MFQKPLTKSAIFLSFLGLPAPSGSRRVVVCEGQLRRFLKAGPGMLAVRPVADTQETQQPEYGGQGSEIVDIHGVPPVFT
jgi:hypothetical protein